METIKIYFENSKREKKNTCKISKLVFQLYRPSGLLGTKGDLYI